MSKLIDYADTVLPVENKALLDIYNRIQVSSRRKAASSSLIDNGDRIFADKTASQPQAFDTMNNIVANLLMNMTSSMRFPGSMNVDISDICTNLVPFPNLKFLSSSLAPLSTQMDVRASSRGFELFSFYHAVSIRSSRMLLTPALSWSALFPDQGLTYRAPSFCVEKSKYPT